MKAFTRFGMLPELQKAFTGINARARAEGFDVVDGTGYAGPGQPNRGDEFGGSDGGNDVGNSTEGLTDASDVVKKALAERTDQPSAAAARVRGLTSTASIHPETGAQQFYGRNPARNRYLSAKYGIDASAFDGKGGFWAAVDERGYDRNSVQATVTAYDVIRNPVTGRLHDEPKPTPPPPPRQPPPPPPPPPVQQAASSVTSSSVANNLEEILDSDGPLMKRARARGLQSANARGLSNSTMAAEAGEAAVLDVALPIGSQDAGQKFTSELSAQEFGQSRVLQHSEIQNQQWLATLDANTRSQISATQENNRIAIAEMQVGAEDREKIAAMLATAQNNYNQAYTAILNNPDIPSDVRGNYLAHIANMMENQIAVIEGMYGVDLEWSAPTGPAV